MATTSFLWISACYGLLTVAICAVEVKRTRTSGPDVLSVFMGLFLLQCCLPGIVIFGCLPITGLHQPTDNHVFDRIFARMDFSSALLVFGLTACFAVLIYVFMGLGAVVMRRIPLGLSGGTWIMLRGSPARLVTVLIVGLVLTMISFCRMGDTLFDRYASLIAFRAGSDEVPSGTLSTLAFLLTETWMWLSVVALFVLFERRGRNIAWYFCLICVVIFEALSVSRKALFVPALLAYFTLVLFDGRWRIKFILVASIPILLIVAFGKDALSAVAFGGSLQEVLGRYQTPASGFLRTASDMGITIVESVGSISLLHIPPRFGVDHLLSIMRGAPLGWILHWLGEDRFMPMRIVRLSTQTFSTPFDQDIPPGLLGQMWLDFRLFGPVVWAFGFAVQLSVVQWVFSSTVRTREAVIALVLVTFIIALPLNTGSYDFMFGIDIVASVLCLLFVYQPVRIGLRVQEST